MATWCRGAQPAFDSAADPAYDGGWLTLSNGGFGWGAPWSFLGSGGSFIGSSTTNGGGDPDGDGDINTPHGPSGRAWGLRRNTPSSVPINNYRVFNGDLSIGQTFEIDMDCAPMSALSSGSWFLMANTAVNVDDQFILTCPSGGPNYLVQTGSTTLDSGVPITDQGAHFAFTLTGVGTYSLAITPNGPGSSTTMLSGQINHPDEPVNVLLLMTKNNTSAESAVFFNNIAITPEPAALTIAALGCSMLTARRRR